MTSEPGRPRYFGPSYARKPWEVQIETPVGSQCIWCEELIDEGDQGTIDIGGSVSHHECLFRQVVGSVAHQEHRCLCYGGTGEDDPELSYRENARLAMRYYRDNPESERFR